MNPNEPANMTTNSWVAAFAILVIACGLTMATVQTNSTVRNTSVPASTRMRQSLPKLLDLGACTCVACKKMVSILDGLKKDDAGEFDVEFVDVLKDPDAGKKKGMEAMPMQIFLNAGGKELYRPIGLYSRDQILAKWKEFGLDLNSFKQVSMENLFGGRVNLASI